MSFDRVGETALVAVVGTLVNNSPHPWEDIQVDVQYFDADGALIGLLDFIHIFCFMFGYSCIYVDMFFQFS